MLSYLYTADSEEPIADFIRRRQRSLTLPLFGGLVPYHQLWDARLLIPEITRLRVFHDGGVGYDQLYKVVDRDTVSGTGRTGMQIDSPEGRRPVRDILEDHGVMWEVSLLNPKILGAQRGTPP